MSNPEEHPVDPPLPPAPAEPAPPEAAPVAHQGVPLPGEDPLRPDEVPPRDDDWGPQAPAPDEPGLFGDGELPPRRPETEEERRRRNPVYRVEERVSVVRMDSLREGDGGSHTLSRDDLEQAWVVLGDEVAAPTQERAIELATTATGGIRGGTFAVSLVTAVTVHTPRTRQVLDFTTEEQA